jgi:two-component system phosphate regulon sensor histidine kinase PhoR
VLGSSRFKLAYLVVLPALVIAACVLGYFSVLTASQFARLGVQSIAESSLYLLEDRVAKIEQEIIAGDNQAIRLVDTDGFASLEQQWKPAAEELTPSVRALVVLDDRLHVMAFTARVARREERALSRLLLDRIVPDLDLPALAPGRLKHLHRRYDGRSQLIAYQATVRDGRRRYVVAQHDVGFLVREVFPRWLGPETSAPWYNVIDEENRPVFGPRLSEAGDYVVGRRFPSTLYMWRLQVAPTAASELQAKSRTSQVNQAALIGLSLVIILVAVIVLLLAADKERRLANLKSDFIATVSHELKTPLSVIRMFGEMLLTGRVRSPDKQQEYLEMICSETERLSGLIENVLDFAALERGKRTYQMRDCDLHAVAARAVDALHYRFERENTAVEIVREGGGEPAVAHVDEEAILLVLINLLDNAMKYAPGAPIQLRVDPGPKEILLRVHDHGPGISPQDLARVFERFYRTRGRDKARGSGIGLAIVKRIAEEHRGRAWAENAPDGGAIVSVAIPRVSGAPTSRTEIDSDPRVPASGEGRAIDTTTPVGIVAPHG